MSEILQLFPIPLYIGTVDVNGLEFLVKDLDYYRTKMDDGSISTNVRILDDDDFSLYRLRILEHITDYIYNKLECHDETRIIITNSWIMRHLKQDRSTPHLHTNSMFSGILYINVDDTSGNLSFHKGERVTIFPPQMDYEFKNKNSLNASIWTFTPKIGDLLIFPSILVHSVDENLSHIDRYCLAFNFMLEGNAGYNKDRLSQLQMKFR
jgi:uncharacterized protein (TIGR02466 family)